MSAPAYIPESLKALNHWVLHKDKAPVTENGIRAAGWDKPDFWRPYNAALAMLEADANNKRFSGLGFIVARLAGFAELKIVAIDLDECRDPSTGWVSPWAEEKLKLLNSFTEVSLTGTGFHVWVIGDLPEGIKSAQSEGMSPDVLPEATWFFIKALKPQATKCNKIEIYADGPKHITVSGQRVEAYPAELEARQEAIIALLQECKFSKKQSKGSDVKLPDWVESMAKAAASKKLPSLNIMDIVDTTGWEACGDQLRGSHPTLGSTTGHNLVINPVEGIWCYMHDGINSGGDAWLWLACECGAIKWEEAGAGALKDRAIVEKTIAYAIQKELVKPEEVIREPEIRPVSLADDIGAMGKGPDGTIQQVIFDKDQGKSLQWISDIAIGIHTETQEDGEKELTFRGFGAQDKNPICVTVLGADMCDHRNFRRAILRVAGSRNRLGKLTYEMVQSVSRNTISRQRVTIPIWRKNIPLIPGVDLAPDVEYKLSALTPALVYDGDKARAREILAEMLELRKYSPILLTAVFGSPLTARWFPNDRYGVALWGITGSNKTTIAQLATGIYGTGYLDDRSLLKHGKLGATPVAAMEILYLSGILPRIIDNVKATDPKDSLQYVALIQATIEGNEKLRGRKEGGLRAARSYQTTPIITGEIKVAEASTSARILNLTWNKEGSNAKLSEVQNNTDVLPVIGYHWLRYLAATGFDIRAGFDQARAKLATEYASRGFENPGRLATIYCLNRGIWNMLKTGPFGDVFEDADEAFLLALDEAILEQGQEVTEETEVSRFLNGLEELIVSRPELFMIGELKAGNKLLGKLCGDEGLFVLPNETLAQMKNLGIFSQIPTTGSITKALDERGILVKAKEKDRKLYQATIGGNRVRGWMLKPDWKRGNEDQSGIEKPDSSGQNTRNTQFTRSKYANVFEGKNLENSDLNKIENSAGIPGITGIINNNISTNIDSSNIVNTRTDTRHIPDYKNDIYEAIEKALKTRCRKDGNKKGLMLSDIEEFINSPGAEKKKIAQCLEAEGWKPVKIEASGLIVYWAPEEAINKQ